MSLSIRIDSREVMRALDGLDKKGGTKAIKAAVKKGGQLLKAPMKAAAPKGPTGNLRKKVGTRVKKSRKDAAGSYYAVTTSFARHRHLVVQGTGPRFTRNGAFRGRMPANDFVSRTADRYEDAAIAAAQEELLRQLDL